MRTLRAFTLIELLIVVAIIAILAAIAVPNFLEAQVRSKVSRVRSDMRSLATGLESYYIDNNQYPAVTNDQLDLSADRAQITGAAADQRGRTFRLRGTTQLSTLTTPVSYLTSIFGDPFSDTRGLSFRYFADSSGWILNSFGPDVDEAQRGDLGFDAAGDGRDNDDANSVETIYDSRISQPSLFLIVGGRFGTPAAAFTYDPTNGTTSEGDVWRTKQ
ncbi:MAG: prepilin-type N-terminal cleavage/methylation domain-containing protein [Candidatus Sumerlaeia bacterium]|nr:prepilin-type N-terminal cleavage/methylation domain-containing protein [Candidatus Sumerlaeia bacterium]